MLSVGDADAIALRYVYPSGSDFVAVIDGGYREHGEQLARMVRTHYHRSHIDLAVASHPDEDHICGLRSLLDLMDIRQVWVHDPSRHTASAILRATRSRAAWLPQARAILKSLDDASEFTAAVDARRIPRQEPFAGVQHGPLTVLGPSTSFCEQMLNEIAVDEGFTKSLRLAQIAESFSEEFLEKYSEYAIDENNETAPSNNTSTIIWIKDTDRPYLFTGDAGVQALESAQRNYDYSNIYWLHVPHHGNRRNLNSAIINYLKPSLSYVSAAGTIKHPSRAVVNALKRANAKVYSTHKSNNLWHHAGDGVPSNREGYVTAEPL